MLRVLKLAVILFITFFAADLPANGQHPRVKAEAERITGDRFKFAARTPLGANVYAVRQPSRQMLNAIDKGLSELFAVARKNRYTRRLNYSEYSIYIANADRTKDANGKYSPDFAIPADQYAGTDFDQGGFIYAAGMVLAYSPMAFIVAEHTRDLDRLANVVRYEGEHLVLFHNDRRRYEATKDHSRGGAHPILN
jgi:hypothetical protein